MRAAEAAHASVLVSEVTRSLRLHVVCRCASLAAQGTITGRHEYASHIIANCCFSASLSTVCYIWHDITRVTVGATFDPKQLLIGVNVGLLVISIVSAGLCIASKSLGTCICVHCPCMGTSRHQGISLSHASFRVDVVL